MKTVVLTCPYGNITDIHEQDNTYAFGINPANKPKFKDACLRIKNEETGFDNHGCS